MQLNKEKQAKYVFTSENILTLLHYSNSVCELLILKLHSPCIIILLMYRLPSGAINKFDDIIDL